MGDPFAPVLIAPAGPGVVSSTFRMVYEHPDSLEANAYDIELVFFAPGGPVVWAPVAATAGIDTPTNTIAAPYTGPALGADQYAWRARVRDTASAYGPWSTWVTFTPGSSESTLMSKWAAIVLNATAEPPIRGDFEGITPIGLVETLALCRREYRDVLRFVDDHTDPPTSFSARVLAMTIRLTPDAVTVDVLTEELEAFP